MAEKRMISKVISISEKVNDLPDVFDMLLFTWMIPHTDDFGRLAGSPAKVKALVVPMLDKLVADVKESLQRLESAGLIDWYEADGQKVVQIVNFEDHQQGLHKRTRSKFPDPPANNDDIFADFPGTSGNFPKIPLEGKGTEGNRTEEKGREQISPDGDSSPPNPYRFYENGFGTISPVIRDNIDDLSKEYGDLWLCEAMKIAILRGKRNLKYVQGILKSWHADGIDEPWTKEKPPSKGNSRGGQKPSIDIVQDQEPAPEVSQEEYEELLRLAERMESGKGEQR
ncbi:DnaD domain protein [Paenibacillus peoriae]|uniref:DnaD domain-containing protein n=1 Tax=Paenibacillus peoriae TaxID=59893 RepID=UPI0032AFF66B